MPQDHRLAIDGCEILHCATHRDARGGFTELFRREWSLGPEPLQWSFVSNEANVLRGVHLHWQHTDYLSVVSGTAVIGLHDMRTTSDSFGRSVMLRLGEIGIDLLVIPPGVAHGFYLPEPACHINAVSHYFDRSDELRCHWTAPELGLAFPCSDPLLSEQDRCAGDYAVLVHSFATSLRV